MTNRVDLLLLRGIHTVDELPAIVRGLRRADVVLLEFVALQSVAKGWLDVLDHLSNDPAFIARVEADL
ncbi:MAG TPA: hypothetical protein VLF67_03060, partial [Candidatus Saccharimonas sp.]|nr:hypothetical protein [Candidatus Saccharimonas sp.]